MLFFFSLLCFSCKNDRATSVDFPTVVIDLECEEVESLIRPNFVLFDLLYSKYRLCAICFSVERIETGGSELMCKPHKHNYIL